MTRLMQDSFLHKVLKLTVTEIENICKHVIFLGSSPGCAGGTVQEITSPYSQTEEAKQFREAWIVFATPQAMTTKSKKADSHEAFLNLPRETFSLIVIDEGHRGMGDRCEGSMRWREIPRYFHHAQVLSMTGTCPSWMENHQLLAEYSFTNGLQDHVLCGIRHWQIGMSHCRVD